MPDICDFIDYVGVIGVQDAVTYILYFMKDIRSIMYVRERTCVSA